MRGIKRENKDVFNSEPIGEQSYIRVARVYSVLIVFYSAYRESEEVLPPNPYPHLLIFHSWPQSQIQVQW